MKLLSKIQENQLENTLNSPVLSSEKLLASTTDEEKKGMVFETSGTTGSPKQIPYTQVDHLKTIIEECFDLAGLNKDVVLNLGAPLPHQSGWCIREGIRETESRFVNQHFKDYQTVLDDESSFGVTALVGTPNVVRAVGEEIAETYGPPTELFPNLEKILAVGDILSSNRKESLIEIWGPEIVREMYATTETGGIASAIDDTRELIPLLHRFICEIIPDKGSDEIIDVREVDEERRGSILITDPTREAVNLTRYRIGDKVAVHPTDDIPRIKVLGREDDSINLSGALLYPSQIHEAVRDTFGTGADWVARVSEPEYPAVDFYIINGEEQCSDRFLKHLFERNGPVREAYHDVGVIEYLKIHHVFSREEIPDLTANQEMKEEHVIFDGSYSR